jgi:hypothetical protein
MTEDKDVPAETASEPPAPARFSMITGWPSFGARISDASRAGKSDGPPGADGMMILIGLSG